MGTTGTYPLIKNLDNGDFIMKKVITKEVKKELELKIKEAELSNNLLDIVREVFEKYKDLAINKRIEKKMAVDFPNVLFRINEEHNKMYFNFSIKSTKIRIQVGNLKSSYQEKDISWQNGKIDIDRYDQSDYIAKYKLELKEVSKAVKKYNKAMELLKEIQDINCQIDQTNMPIKNRVSFSNTATFNKHFPLVKEFGYLN